MAALAGKVAVVTGAGTGIGRATAIAYARRGASVVLAGRRAEPLQETGRLLDTFDGEWLATPTDVGIESDVERMVAVTLERFGRLDIAFNNAGTEGAMKPILEAEETDFDAVIAANLKGVWLCIKHEAKAMIDSAGGGAIVNTSSFLACGAAAGGAIYSASKGALISMVRTLAVELGPQGVRVNNVLPGVVPSPMTDRFFPDGALEHLAKYTPLGRNGAPDDIANAVAWLSGDEGGFMTGQSVSVDGGLVIPGLR